MTTAALIVHGHPASTNTRTVRLLLAEKGVPHGLQLPPFGTDTHAALHPFRKMPALSAGPVQLFESLAICEWAEASLSGPALLPLEPLARAQVLSWCSASVDYLYHDVVKAFAFAAMVPAEERDGAAFEQATGRARSVLAAFAAQLDSSPGPWLVDGRLSLADLYLAPILAFVASLPEGSALLAETPRLGDHLDAMRARSSWRLTDPGAE